MNKKIILVVAMLIIGSLALTACSAPALGGDKSWDKVKSKGEFILGLDENFPPMGFLGDNGEITGFDIDMAKEVCTRLGIKLKTQPINWDAKEQELSTGKIDAIWNGLSITEERKEKILFSKPYMNNRQVLVVMSSSSATKMSDLSGKKLGLQAASSAADALAASKDFKDKLKQVVELKDNMTALMDLEKGSIDTVLMDEVVARYYIQMKNKGYKVLEETLAGEEYAIGFRKKDTALMQKFQDTLEAMKKDGKAAELSKKWLGKDLTTIP